MPIRVEYPYVGVVQVVRSVQRRGAIPQLLEMEEQAGGLRQRHLANAGAQHLPLLKLIQDKPESLTKRPLLQWASNPVGRRAVIIGLSVFRLARGSVLLLYPTQDIDSAHLVDRAAPAILRSPVLVMMEGLTHTQIPEREVRLDRALRAATEHETTQGQQSSNDRQQQYSSSQGAPPWPVRHTTVWVQGLRYSAPSVEPGMPRTPAEWGRYGM